MWISKKITRLNKNEETVTATVSDSSNGKLNTQSSNEYTDVAMVAPSGISYMPDNNKKCILLPVDNEVVSVGCITEDKQLKAGEIMLYANGCKITLTNDGKIFIDGRVFINGVEY